VRDDRWLQVMIRTFLDATYTCQMVARMSTACERRFAGLMLASETGTYL